MKSFTFAMIKPLRGAASIGRVLSFVEEQGFRVEEMRLVRLSPVDVEVFYAEHVGKFFFPAMSAYMTSGPVVPMVLSVDEEDPSQAGVTDRPRSAVARWRRALGATDSRNADPGTLRHRYGNKEGVIFENVAHGADGPEAVARETSIFFLVSSLRGA